jgi:hypothetical protein
LQTNSKIEEKDSINIDDVNLLTIFLGSCWDSMGVGFPSTWAISAYHH